MMKVKKHLIIPAILAAVLCLGIMTMPISVDAAELAATDWVKFDNGGASTSVTAIDNGYNVTSELPGAASGNSAQSTAVLQMPVNIEQALSFDMKINYSRPTDTNDRAVVIGLNGTALSNGAVTEASDFQLKALNPNVTGFQIRLGVDSGWETAPDAAKMTLFYKNAGGDGKHEAPTGSGNQQVIAGGLKLTDMLFNGKKVHVTMQKSDDVYQVRFDGEGEFKLGWAEPFTTVTMDIPVASLDYAPTQSVMLAFSFLNWGSTETTEMGIEITDIVNATYSMSFENQNYVVNAIDDTLDLSEELTVTEIATGDSAVGTVIWTSSDNAIAEVSANGIVTAKKAGSAVITAKLQDGTQTTCTVEVRVPKTSGWTFSQDSYLAAYEAENGTRIIGSVPTPEAGASATVKDIAVFNTRMKPASEISFDLNINYSGAETDRWFAICLNRAEKSGNEINVEDMNVSVIGGLKQTGFQITMNASPNWAGAYTAVDLVTYGYKGQYANGTIPSNLTHNSAFAQHFWAGEAIRVTVTRTDTAYEVKLDDRTITVPHGEISSDGDFAASDDVYLGFKMFNATDSAAAVDFTVSNVKNGLMDGLTLDKTSVSLSKANPTVTLTPSIIWKDGVNHDGADETISWITSDFSVVEVNNGVLTAKAAGSVTITAMTVEGDVAVCTVTVEWKDEQNGSDSASGNKKKGGCGGNIANASGMAALALSLLCAAVMIATAGKKSKER